MTEDEMKATWWRHVKTQGMYNVLGIGLNEGDKTEMVIYRPVKGGQVWLRPKSDFLDGRFEYFDYTVGDWAKFEPR